MPTLVSKGSWWPNILSYYLQKGPEEHWGELAAAGRWGNSVFLLAASGEIVWTLTWTGQHPATKDVWCPDIAFSSDDCISPFLLNPVLVINKAPNLRDCRMRIGWVLAHAFDTRYIPSPGATHVPDFLLIYCSIRCHALSHSHSTGKRLASKAGGSSEGVTVLETLDEMLSQAILLGTTGGWQHRVYSL